jgi:membrane protease YdiL (CAAX protease family)
MTTYLKNPTTLFFLVAFGMPWLGWSSMHILGLTEPSPLRTVLFYTGNFCSVGGLVAMYAFNGKTGVTHLLKRCIEFRVPLAWWLIAIAVPFLISFLAYLLVVTAGDGIGTVDLRGFSLYLAPSVLIMFTTGPWGEELGWRGYLTPKLLETSNALVASLVVGLLWGIWHLPLYIHSVFSTFSGGLAFTVDTMLTSVIMTAILLHTRGSVLVAVLYHWLINATPSVVDAVFVDINGDDMYLVSLAVQAVVVVIFVLVLGKNLTRGSSDIGYRATDIVSSSTVSRSALVPPPD